MNAWNAGSVALSVGCVTTMLMSSDGVPEPAPSKAANPLDDSVCAAFGLPFGSSVLIPPVNWLSMKSPIVPRNQSPATGQRWRELHMATRTVPGSPPERCAG